MGRGEARDGALHEEERPAGVAAYRPAPADRPARGPDAPRGNRNQSQAEEQAGSGRRIEAAPGIHTPDSADTGCRKEAPAHNGAAPHNAEPLSPGISGTRTRAQHDPE